jgi:hypothetical protein
MIVAVIMAVDAIVAVDEKVVAKSSADLNVVCHSQ